jgi:Zn finger protein HypA/HybF involved in hydrogenase expression
MTMRRTSGTLVCNLSHLGGIYQTMGLAFSVLDVIAICSKSEGAESMSNETTGLMCEDCHEAFSEFLQEMADKNAEVVKNSEIVVKKAKVVCPKCRSHHDRLAPHDAMPHEETLSLKRIV